MIHRAILTDYEGNETVVLTKYYPTVSWHRWLDKRRFFITELETDNKLVFEGKHFITFEVKEVIDEGYFTSKCGS